MEVIQLQRNHEYQEAYPLMHELRTNLSEKEFYGLLEEMQTKGYKLFAIKDKDTLVCLAGAAVQSNLYYGKHLWIYDLVTKIEHRSKNYGTKMLLFLEGFAKENGCRNIALSSGLQRELAHKFYERADYQKASYVFKKQL